MFRVVLALATLVIVFAGIVVSQQTSSGITEAMLKAHVKFLSDDKLEGRGTGAPVARDMGLRVSPDARPEQGSFYRSDHFPFAKAGVPSISLKEGSDYVGHSKEWGEEQFKAYNTAHYHQPSDEMRDTWDFRALIQSAEIGLAIGRMISDLPEKLHFNPDDEFAKKPATR